MTPPRFVIRMTAPEIDDTSCLAVIASRFIVTDASTGERLWNPLDRDPSRLRRAVARWLYNVRDVAIDPADPLSRLLVECACPVDCPVHGSSAAQRRRRVQDVYQRTGSLTETARHFGVSYQRIQQLLRPALEAR